MQLLQYLKMNPKEYLKAKGIRPSLQRMAVMSFLLENRIHPTADEIFSGLSPDIPTLSRTTVYNTLDLLVEKDAIIMLDIDAKFKRYDGYTGFHGHFKCDICKRIEDIEIKDDSFIALNTPKGVNVRDTQLLYKGICTKCNKKQMIN